MNYAKKQLIFFALYLVAGALFVAAALLWAPAEMRGGIVSGLLGGFLVTGAGGLFLSARLLKNPAEAERVELGKTEERTQFISLKTRSAVHFTTIMLVSAGAVTAEILGSQTVALTLAALLAVQAFLFVCFASYYSKKY